MATAPRVVPGTAPRAPPLRADAGGAAPRECTSEGVSAWARGVVRACTWGSMRSGAALLLAAHKVKCRATDLCRSCSEISGISVGIALALQYCPAEGVHTAPALVGAAVSLVPVPAPVGAYGGNIVSPLVVVKGHRWPRLVFLISVVVCTRGAQRSAGCVAWCGADKRVEWEGRGVVLVS